MPIISNIIFNPHIKKLLSKPSTEILIKRIEENVQVLSPDKNLAHQRNVKYTLTDYVIEIIDVLRFHFSWNNYSKNMNGNTLRKNILNGLNSKLMNTFIKNH